MILRSIVILVAMAAGTAFALDHPPLPHRVLHVISPAQLEATCPGTFACAIVDWGRRTCHVYVPNAHLPGRPSRRKLLAHEFRPERGQDPDPFPCRSLRHVVYAALLHFGLETAREKPKK